MNMCEYSNDLDKRIYNSFCFVSYGVVTGNPEEVIRKLRFNSWPRVSQVSFGVRPYIFDRDLKRAVKLAVSRTSQLRTVQVIFSP